MPKAKLVAMLQIPELQFPILPFNLGSKGSVFVFLTFLFFIFLVISLYLVLFNF